MTSLSWCVSLENPPDGHWAMPSHCAGLAGLFNVLLEECVGKRRNGDSCLMQPGEPKSRLRQPQRRTPAQPYVLLGQLPVLRKDVFKGHASGQAAHDHGHGTEWVPDTGFAVRIFGSIATRLRQSIRAISRRSFSLPALPIDIIPHPCGSAGQYSTSKPARIPASSVL